MKISASEAVTRLKNGEVVGIPTETVYGLAGQIFDESALGKIFAIKQRPFFDPLIVHVAELAQTRDLVTEWPELYDFLAAKFWPGPLTLIAPKSAKVSDLITSGFDTVALRCPRHPLALEILRALQIPLAAPSANLFTRTSPTCFEDVENEFAGAVPIVDGGPCEVGLESTVLRAERIGPRWRVELLRPGGIGREELRAALTAGGFDCDIERATSKAAPGQLEAHYQPKSPLVILEDRDWSPQIQAEVAARLNFIPEGLRELRLPAEPFAAARTLYQTFRREARGPKHILWIRRLPAYRTEAWEAVWDRLERAASLRL